MTFQEDIWTMHGKELPLDERHPYETEERFSLNLTRLSPSKVLDTTDQASSHVSLPSSEAQGKCTGGPLVQKHRRQGDSPFMDVLISPRKAERSPVYQDTEYSMAEQ